MFGLGAAEIAVILIIALLLFGKRLPELGATLGKAIKNFKGSLENNNSDSEASSQKKINYSQNDIECEVSKVEEDKK